MAVVSLSDFRATTNDPLPGATDAPLTSVFTVDFNYPVDMTTATFDVISFSKVAGGDGSSNIPVNFTISTSIDGLSLILTPDTTLEPGSEYVVIVRGSDDQTDYSLKNKLGYDLRWTFVSRFSTSNILITAPVLSLPTDRTSVEAPLTLSWEESTVSIYDPTTGQYVTTVPTRYEVIMATDTDFSTEVFSEYVSGALSVTVGVILQENVDYFWKVRAQYFQDTSTTDLWHYSRWSNVRQFYLGYRIPGESFTDALGETSVLDIYVAPAYSINIVDDGVFIPTNSDDDIIITFGTEIDASSIAEGDITLTYRTLPYHRGRPESLTFTYTVTSDSLVIHVPMGWENNLIYTLTLSGINNVSGLPLINGTDIYSFIYGLDPLYVDWVYIDSYVDSMYSISNIDLAKLVLSLMYFLQSEYYHRWRTTDIPVQYDRYIECFILNAVLADLGLKEAGSPDSFSSNHFTLGDLTIKGPQSSSEGLPAVVNKYVRDAQSCLGQMIPGIKYAVKGWYRFVPPSIGDHRRTQYMPPGTHGWPIMRKW